jgi:gamma-glutamylcyclotransferase (GGCT)/AIG2-like uncharacterized protein YtfP
MNTDAPQTVTKPVNPADESPYLFVYGTLKRGGDYHNLYLDGIPFLQAAAVTQDAYFLVVDPRSGLPMLFETGPQTRQITGELYRVRRQGKWWKMDRLEGHPHLYRRKLVTILCKGKSYDAWLYFCQISGERLEPLLKLPALTEYAIPGGPG